MRSIASLALVLTLIPRGGAAEPVATLDLIPADAMAGIAARNLNELKKKADDLFKQLEVKNAGMGPTDLFDEAVKFLNVKAGLDPDGSAAFILANRDVVGED